MAFSEDALQGSVGKVNQSIRCYDVNDCREPVKMNPAHKPAFSPFVSHSAFVQTHYSIMSSVRFTPLSPLQHNSSARSHPAKSTSDWRHVYTSFGTPAVLGDNSSHHSLHPSLRESPIVPWISVTSPDHSLLKHYRQKAYRCDSEYTPAIAMSPHHFTGTGEFQIWKLQSLGPFGVEESRSELCVGSLIRLFDAELDRYTLGFEKHILCGRLVKALWRERGIQIYQIAVDRFTVTRARIAVEQTSAYVAILLDFIATSDVIAEISPSSLGQEVSLGGVVIFPVRKWTHPPNAEMDWLDQQERRETGKDVNYMLEEH